MKIGVISDCHDQLHNLNVALEYFTANDVDSVIFCGDFCSPIPVKLGFAKFKGEVHAVFGNTEDRHLITQLSLTEVRNLKIHGEHAELEFENIKIAVTHYPFYAHALAKTGDYDAVFYGHQHSMQIDYYGKTLCANPGELLGFKEDPGFGLYDTQSNKIDIIKLKDI